jgi:hypothetical protein
MLIFEASKIILFSISLSFLSELTTNDYWCPKMEVTALMGSVMSPPELVKLLSN